MIFVLAATALGSPLYPRELETLSGAPCAPACTVCHDTNRGGSGTVVQPFGRAMEDRGMGGGTDRGSVASAYTALIDDAVDSDDDGTPDEEALAHGVDPSSGDPFCGVEAPTYGCLSHVPTAPGLGLLVALGLAARRRRGQSRSGGSWNQGASAL